MPYSPNLPPFRAEKHMFISASSRSPDSWFPDRLVLRRPRLPKHFSSVAREDDFPLTVARPHRLLPVSLLCPRGHPKRQLSARSSAVSSPACQVDTVKHA